MAQGRARLFSGCVAPLLVARSLSVPQPTAVAALVSAGVSARGGSVEHRAIRHPHLLRPRTLPTVFGCAATFRDDRSQRPELCGCDHVGAWLTRFSDSSCA